LDRAWRELGFGHARRARLQRKVLPVSRIRRAARIADAQGGINAVKNYQSRWRHRSAAFTTPSRGGDFGRATSRNVYRLAEITGISSINASRQVFPFAREYGGTLANRSFGGAHFNGLLTRAGRPASTAAGRHLRHWAHGRGARPDGPRTDDAGIWVWIWTPRAYQSHQLVTAENRIAVSGRRVSGHRGYGNVYFFPRTPKIELHSPPPSARVQARAAVRQSASRSPSTFIPVSG